MIEGICIDDKNKPEIIPQNKWVKEGEKYNIVHIYKMMNQMGIQGCELEGIDISMYPPYNCFRLNRFAFTKENLDKLFEMIKECTELNDIDISELLKEVSTLEPVLN